MAKEKRLDETIGLIHRAISSCGADFATLNVRAKLLAALDECSKVDKKRDKRQRNYLQEMAEKALKNNDNWWKQIQENVNKAVAKENQPEEDQEEA